MSHIMAEIKNFLRTSHYLAYKLIKWLYSHEKIVWCQVNSQ